MTLKSLRFLAAPLLLLSLAACNTVEGAGEDIQAGGKAVEDTAVKAKKAITE